MVERAQNVLFAKLMPEMPSARFPAVVRKWLRTVMVCVLFRMEMIRSFELAPVPRVKDTSAALMPEL